MRSLFVITFLGTISLSKMLSAPTICIRLGAMWSGLQPEEGTFNETYVAVLQEIVAGLAEHGVHTYLDMHQVPRFQSAVMARMC